MLIHVWPSDRKFSMNCWHKMLLILKSKKSASCSNVTLRPEIKLYFAFLKHSDVIFTKVFLSYLRWSCRLMCGDFVPLSDRAVSEKHKICQCSCLEPPCGVKPVDRLPSDMEETRVHSKPWFSQHKMGSLLIQICKLYCTKNLPVFPRASLNTNK